MKKHNFLKKLLSIPALCLACSLSFWLLAGCGHKPPAVVPSANYDFTYTGTLNILDPVCFTATGINTKSKCIWDFGDGTSSSAIAPCHLYTSQGTYIVRLVVDNDIAHKVQKTLNMIQVSGTEYTYLIGGNRNWHHYTSQYMYTYTQRDTLADTSFAVQVLNHTSVCIGTDTIPFDQCWPVYDTAGRVIDTTISFLKNTSSGSLNFDLHQVLFYVKANKVYYSENVYKGAGLEFSTY